MIDWYDELLGLMFLITSEVYKGIFLLYRILHLSLYPAEKLYVEMAQPIAW